MKKGKQIPVFVPVSNMQVASWSPGAEGEGVPPTQVHILYTVEDLDVQFLMRLKSREAADALINALIEHRDYVWGEADNRELP